jgi:hypothetical protein
MKDLGGRGCVNSGLLLCRMVEDRALVMMERWRRWAGFDDAVINGSVFLESLQFRTAEDLQDDE